MSEIQFPAVRLEDLQEPELSAVTRLLFRMEHSSGTKVKEVYSFELSRISPRSLSVLIKAATPGTNPDKHFESTAILHAFVSPKGALRIASVRQGCYMLTKKELEAYK